MVVVVVVVVRGKALSVLVSPSTGFKSSCSSGNWDDVIIQRANRTTEPIDAGCRLGGSEVNAVDVERVEEENVEREDR